MERTFVMVKPDGVQRALVGEIIARIERKGFKLRALKMLQIDAALAAAHYQEHAGKSFYDELLDFIQSGPVAAMVWEGAGVVQSIRLLMGATNPLEALPGTIRGDLSIKMSNNVVHGSDSVESAEREIKLFFKENEIMAYDRTLDK